MSWKTKETPQDKDESKYRDNVQKALVCCLGHPSVKLTIMPEKKKSCNNLHGILLIKTQYDICNVSQYRFMTKMPCQASSI